MLLVLPLYGQLSCAQEEPAKRVLVLNSYHREFLWTDSIVKGIESVMGSEENDIGLTIEYMDTKSIKYDARYKEKLYDLYKYKYGNRTSDLIIATDDNAFDFLREYHEDIFPETPVVFCGVNNLEAPNLVDRDVFTGVIELLSVKETMDIALSLHPETREIVFVVDSTPTGTQLWSQIRGLPGYSENIRMTRIDDSLSMEQIEDTMSRLSDDTIVIFVTLNRDNSGTYYSSKEVVPRVCRASVRPVYGCSAQILPHGIVGGELIGGVYHGQVAATMAMRILAGDAVRDIPVITEPQTQTMFDYNQMQRWGIKESDLPEDSIIVNKPYSVYEENKGLLLSIIACVIVQTLIIVALVVNRSRRKAAEKELKESEDRFRMIFDSINDAVFTQNIETGAILNVNNTTCNLFGYTREELQRLGVQTISAGEAPYTWDDAIGRIKKATAGEPQLFEWRAKHRSGHLFWVEVSMIRAVVGKHERILVVMRDITERKHLEERMTHLNLVLHAIRSVSQLVAKENDRDRLLQRACDNLIETRGYHNAWIALIDESGTLITTAEAGLGEAFVPMVKRLERGELIECGKKALLQSGVVVIDDPISACHGCPLAEMCEGRRAMTIRLEHGGWVYGLFSVAVPAKLAADQEEQVLFKEVAGDIAFSLHSLKLGEKRKRAEDALVESERKLSQIVNGSSTPIFVIDKTHTVTHWNKACENLTGVSAEEMVGTKRQWSPFYSTERPTLADIIVDELTEEEIAGYYGGKFRRSVLINGAYEAEGSFPGFGGKWLFFTAAPLRDDHGNVTGAIESLRDITERKVAERKVRESERKFRSLVEQVPAITYIAALDESSTTLYVSSQIEEILGSPHEEYKTDPDFWAKRLHKEDRKRVLEEMSHAHETGNPFVSEYRMTSTAGKTVWISDKGVIVKDDRGNALYLLGVMFDITTRKLAEENLEQAMADMKRSNTDLEQFAYVISHDLQEPLRMVSSYVQLLSRRYKDKLDSEANDFIGFAVDGASRMQTLIQDLLKYSRVGTRGKSLTPAACEDALNQALANLKLAIEDSGAVVTHDPLPTVLADSSQLVGLFQNLIGNAIKFKGEDMPHIHVAAEQKEDRWLFSVADNGIGIDPEFFERIFVVFQRLNGREEYEGTGIGLAVCKKIVERHGGRMWVESEPGRGSTFYFTIPIKASGEQS
jgi:PAS domain S-box-containing protein